MSHFASYGLESAAVSQVWRAAPSAGARSARARATGIAADYRRPALRNRDLLRSHVTSLDLWSTEYVQALTGENPVAEFTKGSFVGVWLSALTEDEAQDFELDYRQSITKAYPRGSNGVTLFPFRRFFLVAQR